MALFVFQHMAGPTLFLRHVFFLFMINYEKAIASADLRSRSVQLNAGSVSIHVGHGLGCVPMNGHCLWDFRQFCMKPLMKGCRMSAAFNLSFRQIRPALQRDRVGDL